MSGKPQPRHKSGSGQSGNITLTICASEATLERLTTLLLFAERPSDTENEKAGLGPLPWEDPADARFVPVPKTTEELQTEATQLITSITRLFTTGIDDVKKLLASFGVTRLRELPSDKLPQFIAALRAAQPAEL